MIVFPNAKINLGLNITEKRPDGYHNLETVYYPVSWEDALEVIRPAHSNDKYTLQVSGKIAVSDATENLVIKAYKMLDADFDLPPVDIYLYKNIPVGAGLGGGSSDAAFMLRVLNDIYKLGLKTNQLEDYAARLGADCAFFVNNQPVFASGIGNIFTPVSLSLKNYQIIIIKPDVFISTRDAFLLINPHKPVRGIDEIIKLPVAEWKNHLTNDFEQSVFVRYPELRKLKELFYENGAIYASMSGSGSSVYGLFEPGYSIPDIVLGTSIHFRSVLS